MGDKSKPSSFKVEIDGPALPPIVKKKRKKGHIGFIFGSSRRLETRALFLDQTYWHTSWGIQRSHSWKYVAVLAGQFFYFLFFFCPPLPPPPHPGLLLLLLLLFLVFLLLRRLNSRAVISFPFRISSLAFIPNPVALSVSPFFC